MRLSYDNMTNKFDTSDVNCNKLCNLSSDCKGFTYDKISNKCYISSNFDEQNLINDDMYFTYLKSEFNNIN
jgi:hypothetical protein